MCGLTGIYGNTTHQEKEAFRWLLHFNVVRGEDSTGVLAVHQTWEAGKKLFPYFVYKEVGEPVELYDSYPDVFVNDRYTPHGCKLLMGHNRHMTQGKVNVESAHPFDFPNLVGAHNGTVYQHSLKGFFEAEKYEVDSQIIFSHLSHTNNIQEIWSKAHGALALTWWHKDTNTLNIVRNDQRSLFYCLSKDKRTFFWASEDWMLKRALLKANIKFEKVVPFEEDKHYQIQEDFVHGISIKETALIPFVEPPVQTYQQGAGFTNSKPYSSYQGTEVVKIKEYVKEGVEDWQGYFVGEDDFDKEEIIIRIDSASKKKQKERYNIIMNRFKSGMKYYTYEPKDLHAVQGYLILPFNSLTMSFVKDKPNVISYTHVVVNGESLDKKTFEARYDSCLCGKKISFSEARECVFVSDVAICTNCKDDPMVQEYVKEFKDAV
jgi:glucosamine 6-phosphate synthetase-like amidotransferase/phosphosugar isomerase protein